MATTHTAPGVRPRPRRRRLPPPRRRRIAAGGWLGRTAAEPELTAACHARRPPISPASSSTRSRRRRTPASTGTPSRRRPTAGASARCSARARAPRTRSAWLCASCPRRRLRCSMAAARRGAGSPGRMASLTSRACRSSTTPATRTAASTGTASAPAPSASRASSSSSTGALSRFPLPPPALPRGRGSAAGWTRYGLTPRPLGSYRVPVRAGLRACEGAGHARAASHCP